MSDQIHRCESCGHGASLLAVGVGFHVACQDLHACGNRGQWYPAQGGGRRRALAAWNEQEASRAENRLGGAKQ